MKEKQVWLDNTRALATIAVIFLHVSAPILYKYGSVSNEIWWTANVYDSMVRFCVPVFFMLSGALLLSKDYSLGDFFKKRFLRIIPPFIFWSLIYTAYGVFIDKENSYTLFALAGKTVKNILQGSYYHLWFVYTLLGLYFFVPILRKWIKNASNKEVLYFIAIWLFALAYEIPNLKNYLPNFTLVNFTGFIGYLVLGYYLANTKIQSKFIAVAMIVLGITVTIFGTYYLTHKKNEFSEYFYGYLTPNVIMTSVGVFILLKNYDIENEMVKKIISFISNYSFGIYLIHVLILELLDRVGITLEILDPIFSIPLKTMICLLLSGAIIYLLRKIKYGEYISG